MLERRRAEVAQGVAAAQESQIKLQEIEASRAQVLATAGKEADDLLAKTRSAAAAKERELIAAGEAAAATAVREAELQAADLKQKAIAESKAEVAKLIVLGVEKALRQDSGQALTK